MKSTHHFWPETTSSGIPNVVGVGIDLIVKSPVQGVKRGMKEGGRGDEKVLPCKVTQQLLWKKVNTLLDTY